MFDEDVARPLFQLLCGHHLSDTLLNEVVAAWVGRQQQRRSQVGRQVGGAVDVLGNASASAGSPCRASRWQRPNVTGVVLQGC